MGIFHWRTENVKKLDNGKKNIKKLSEVQLETNFLLEPHT